MGGGVGGLLSSLGFEGDIGGGKDIKEGDVEGGGGGWGVIKEGGGIE